MIVGYANGTTNPSSVIASVITDTNSSMANTAGMPEQVNLVGVFDTTGYIQSASGPCADLSNLKAGTAGLAGLLSARETTRADLVGLMVPNNGGGYSGCADEAPAGGNPNAAFFVFSEADVAPAANHYAGSHEIGHNLGANHNPENCSPVCGVPYSYSYGHLVNGVASDIMTYDNLTNCPSRCNRVPQYSTPAADFVGHPGYRAGISGQRDNGASMLNLASYVANYRYPVWRWYLRNSNTAGSPNITVDYGTPGCSPVKGDWDGNGSDTLGEYCGGWWYLRNSNTPGPPDVTVNYGAAGYVPVVGDWDGNGTDTIGVISGSTWYLRNSNTPGSANITFSYGSSYDQFVVGNWDGIGSDGIGIYESGNWYLRRTPSGGASQISFSYGTTGYVAVTGNWDALLGDSIGVVSGSTWYLRNSNNGGAPNVTVTYGDPSYTFLPGDWDNNNSDTIGVVQHLP